MPLDPTLPEMVEDPLLRRLLMLEDRLMRLEQSNPLVRAQVNDDAGRKRLRIGYLDPSSDAAGFGLELFDTNGASVLRADEAGIVSGGQLRAFTIDGGAVQVYNSSLTTTIQQVLQLSFTKPSWATKIILFAASMGQISETSAKNLILNTEVNGTGTGTAAEATVAAGSTAAISVPLNYTTTVAGSTYTIETKAKVNSGTNSTNVFTLNAIVFWLK